MMQAAKSYENILDLEYTECEKSINHVYFRQINFPRTTVTFECLIHTAHVGHLHTTFSGTSWIR